MPDSTGIEVSNTEQLIKALNKLQSGIRSTATMAGLEAGANYINSSAKSALDSSKKGKSKTAYSYYATAFKMEALKNDSDAIFGIRTGIKDKKNAYKLRWIEFGTGNRKTHNRNNPLTKQTTSPMNRGRIVGSNFFFGTVKNNQAKIFDVVSEAVINSLRKITNGQ